MRIIAPSLFTIFVALSSPSVHAADVRFRDDLSAAALESSWSFVREDASAYTLTDRPGFLRIQTQRGAVSDGVPVNNLLLRPATGDFILETKLEFNPERAQQFAGLLVYQDDANALALGLVYVSGARGVFRGVAMLGVTDGVASASRPSAFYDEGSAENPNVVHLRLLRNGDQFVAGFSEDGLAYTDIGTLTTVLSREVRVGFAAANGDFADCGADCDLSIPADFDFFQLSTFAGDDDPTGGVTLESVELEGPGEVDHGASGEFTLIATLSDGTTLDVTEEADWTIAPVNLGSIDQGVFTAANVNATSQATIVAAYTRLSSGGAETETDSLLVRIAVPAPASPLACGAAMLPTLLLSGLMLGLAPRANRRRHPHRGHEPRRSPRRTRVSVADTE